MVSTFAVDEQSASNILRQLNRVNAPRLSEAILDLSNLS